MNIKLLSLWGATAVIMAACGATTPTTDEKKPENITDAVQANTVKITPETSNDGVTTVNTIAVTPDKTLTVVQQPSTGMPSALQSALDEGLRKQFIDHLQTHHASIRAMSDEQVTTFVNEGALRAYNYGFQNPRTMVKFMSLLAVMGKDFDTTQPWATTILAEPEDPNNNQARMDKLYKAALKSLD